MYSNKSYPGNDEHRSLCTVRYIPTIHTGRIDIRLHHTVLSYHPASVHLHPVIGTINRCAPNQIQHRTFIMRIVSRALSTVDKWNRWLSKRGFNSTKQLLVLLSILFVLSSYELAVKPFLGSRERRRVRRARRARNAQQVGSHAALWSGEEQRNPALKLFQVQQIEIALAYCNADVSWLAEELVHYVQWNREKTNEVDPSFRITVLSKCGNEDSIPDFAQDMNKVLGATYIVSRTVDVQVEIITLVNKGGCDMAHMHYINQYIEKNTAASAENSVVLFLKDSPRTKQFLHASLRWRKISEMIFYASRGEFICGIKSRCHTSVFHDSDVLKKYILTNYIRTGDQIATGEDFNASKYKDLGDFVKKELDWSFPEDEDLIEVCYGGTFAVPASKLLSDPRLEKDLKRFEQILSDGPAMSIAEHFAERLWAGFLANPLNEADSAILQDLMESFAGKNGSYMGTLRSNKLEQCESVMKF